MPRRPSIDDTSPGSAPEAVLVRVPGKVNLHLGVGPIGTDGYHPVVTVLQAVSVYDEILARPAEEVLVSLAGVPSPGSEPVPTGPQNLAVRAATVLAARAG